MTVESSLAVPANLSFEQAIALSQTVIDQWQNNALDAGAIAQWIGDLVASENGARGFFVTWLTDPRPLLENGLPAIVQGLSTHPERVAPLLVKNLAMSTAMAIAHQQASKPDLAESSRQVQQRSLNLIRTLANPFLQHHLQALASTLDTGSGEYQTFLERWGYDAEQMAAMRHILEQTGLLASQPCQGMGRGS